MDGIYFDRSIDLDIIQKAVENRINFFNIFCHDSIEVVPVLRIIEFLTQELGKGLNGHEGVSIRWTSSMKKMGRGGGCGSSGQLPFRRRVLRVVFFMNVRNEFFSPCNPETRSRGVRFSPSERAALLRMTRSNSFRFPGHE